MASYGHLPALICIPFILFVATAVLAAEESLPARLEARVHRCVRDNSPGLVIPVGSFAEMAKVETCGVKGMTALYVPTAATDVKDLINGCIDDNDFPDSVMPSVGRFKDCITRALT